MTVLPPAFNSNLHPAESVAEVEAMLRDFAAPVREQLGWAQVGIDLRLGSRALRALAADPEALAGLRRACDAAGVLPYTLNCFPLEAFQSPVVKDRAYQPDWTSDERLADSLLALDIIGALCDERLLSISTVPGSYKPWGPQRCDPARIAAAWGSWAAAALRLHEGGGPQVVLCPEPEPWCMLETSAEVAAFWQGALAEQGVAAAAAALDGDERAARQAIDRHLGLCFDTCHVSVAYEDQGAAARRCRDCGAWPLKVQVSACPELRDPCRSPEGLARLRALTEPRFLHQSAALHRDGRVVRVPDLDRLDELLVGEPLLLRSHYHIPLDRPPGAGLHSTVSDSVLGLAAARALGARHLAVETYTWSILADRPAERIEGTVAELRWLAEQLNESANAEA